MFLKEKLNIVGAVLNKKWQLYFIFPKQKGDGFSIAFLFSYQTDYTPEALPIPSLLGLSGNGVGSGAGVNNEGAGVGATGFLADGFFLGAAFFTTFFTAFLAVFFTAFFAFLAVFVTTFLVAFLADFLAG
jgi:hypothetical protein